MHHIDPSGHNSGVVYSEMQGRENTSSDLMNLRWVLYVQGWSGIFIIFDSMQRLIYQEGSGYRSEVGGLMEALRALDVQQSMYDMLASKS